ncbi:hypothetical protein [Promicromonospora iranensis]|jgi:hypothetical protein|uniref:hypothetical protein n=1 Tax=Promicromonospora iranensis TaxID=1105144 RepID=UPI0023A9BEFB|nr:hypothetical protein [Promicromonospora iranensis]
MRRTSGRVVALLVAGVFALSGCTTGSGDDAAGDGSAGGEPAAPVEATGSARTVTGSMAETTADVPGDAGMPGTLTLTLRAVDVSEQTMTVRWALRWDGDDAEPDAALSYYDMGLGTAVSVIDPTNLKAYRPFCTDGTWKGEAVDAVRCKASMLASARDEVGSKFPNHGTVEGWASLPAPEGRPATVDVMPIEGLPGFTQAEVTYLDGDS